MQVTGDCLLRFQYEMITEGIRSINQRTSYVWKYYDGFECEEKSHSNLWYVISRLGIRREKQANNEINLLQIESDFKSPNLNRADDNNCQR